MSDAGVSTKANLLDAAREEFARYGLAGARVDRVARAAGANVQRIYAYFGDKQGLFEQVMIAAARELGEALGPDHADIEEYAERLFDHVVRVPGNSRIMSWARLERGDDFFQEVYADAHTGWNDPVELLRGIAGRGGIDGRWDVREVFDALISVCEGSRPLGLELDEAELTARREILLHIARSFRP